MQPRPDPNLKELITSVRSQIVFKAADFSFDEAIEEFGLEYKVFIGCRWDIEKEVEGKEFPLTPYIESLLDNYSVNFDRSSEAVCRTAIDFILNECLTVMKGDNMEEAAGANSRLKTPKVKIYGEVSFSHELIPQGTAPPHKVVIINDRVDYAIGRVLRVNLAENAAEHRKRPFHSLLLLVEAKNYGGVEHSLPQLIVYLASLRQSRLQRKWKDATVYGVASDGFAFIFVKISHDGTVKRSRWYDIMSGQLKVVLLVLRHILETTVEKTAGDNTNDETVEPDPALDLDDNPFLMRPGENEEEADW